MNEVREIPLTQGCSAIVDDSDYESLNQHKWCVHKIQKSWYAVRSIRVDGRTIMEQMHRRIMNAPSGLEVDHKNGNGLDNRRDNLRLCTHSQNLKNRVRVKLRFTVFKGVHKTNPTKSRGIRKRKPAKKYVAVIVVNGENIYLGSFHTEESAARAYDKAAVRYFGEFASLNFPNKNED